MYHYIRIVRVSTGSDATLKVNYNTLFVYAVVRIKRFCPVQCVTKTLQFIIASPLDLSIYTQRVFSRLDRFLSIGRRKRRNKPTVGRWRTARDDKDLIVKEFD